MRILDIYKKQQGQKQQIETNNSLAAKRVTKTLQEIIDEVIREVPPYRVELPYAPETPQEAMRMWENEMRRRAEEMYKIHPAPNRPLNYPYWTFAFDNTGGL